MGRIALIAAQQEQTAETSLAREINKVITVITWIGVIVSLLFFFISLIMQFLWLDSLIYLIGIIVACVPEALLPTITVGFGFSSGLFWRLEHENSLN